jgi:hypothetical protein
MMTQSIIYGGPPKWEGIWENLPELIQWAYPSPPADIIVLLNQNKLDKVKMAAISVSQYSILMMHLRRNPV